MKFFPCSLIKSQNIQRFGRAYWSSLPNSRGQAAVEYILIVVLGVTLVIALSMALFKPLGDYVQGLNQGYIQCLLETGELPGLRSEAASTLCAPPAFSARGLDGEPIPANQAANSKNDKSTSENKSNADTTGGASASGGGNTSAYNRKSSVIRNGMRGVGNARSDNAGNKTTTIPVDSFDEGSGFFSSNTNSGGRFVRSRKSRQLAIASLTEYERKKVEREQRKMSSLPLENESFTQKQNKKIIVKPPPEKVKDQEIQVGTDFSFYFKIFFLIILILFILILFGGQAMQLSKNWGD